MISRFEWLKHSKFELEHFFFMNTFNQDAKKKSIYRELSLNAGKKIGSNTKINLNGIHLQLFIS